MRLLRREKTTQILSKMKRHSISLAIVDDEKSSRERFQKVVTDLRLSIHLIFFKNGLELIAYINERETVIPDVIFLKLNLPEKDGLVCLKEIRKQERLKNVLVAIYSNKATEDKIEEAFVNGANIYMDKPRDYELLKKVLEKILIINFQYIESNLDIQNFIYRI